MTLRMWTIPAALCGSVALATGAGAAEPAKAWQVDGLDAPESAVLDAGDGTLYVSNINGEVNAADGNGYISKLSATGEMVEKAWVEGLNAPKGLAFHDGKLYVADIDELVVIDTASGEIAERYKADGTSFLNDVSAHEDGRVFVTEMMLNQIWQLDGGEFELWLEDPALENPNGVLAEGDRLLVASWGVMKEGFETEVPGHVKTIDYASKQIESLGGGKPVGNLDGLEPDGQGGYLATDWMAGSLYRLDAEGGAETVLELGQGTADLEFIEGESLAVIPMMMDGAVAAYKVE